jgi:hypothetical protein
LLLSLSLSLSFHSLILLFPLSSLKFIRNTLVALVWLDYSGINNTASIFRHVTQVEEKGVVDMPNCQLIYPGWKACESRSLLFLFYCTHTHTHTSWYISFHFFYYNHIIFMGIIIIIAWMQFQLVSPTWSVARWRLSFSWDELLEQSNPLVVLGKAAVVNAKRVNVIVHFSFVMTFNLPIVY